MTHNTHLSTHFDYLDFDLHILYSDNPYRLSVSRCGVLTEVNSLLRRESDRGLPIKDIQDTTITPLLP